MIELADLREALKIDEDDTSQDDYVTALEAAAVAYVERVTDRYFGPPAARTEYLSAMGGREVWLRETPVAVAPATDPVITVLLDDVEVDAADFAVRERRLRHTSGWGTAYTESDLVVTYAAGYVAGGEPEDIRKAVTEIVGLWYYKRIPIADAAAGGAEVPHMASAILRTWKRVVA